MNTFNRVNIPKPSRKVIPTFLDEQLRQLFDAIDRSTPAGYLDYTIVLMLLDTALRISELCGIQLKDLSLDDGVAKFMGKGNKERIVFDYSLGKVNVDYIINL